MTLDLSQLLLFSIITTALHWLIARSEIARPLWSRATGWFAKLLACPACSGWWLGAFLSNVVAPITLVQTEPPLYLDVLVRSIVHGLLGVFVTPVLEGVLVWGLRESAIVEVDPEPAAEPPPLPRADSDNITPSDNFLRKPRT